MFYLFFYLPWLEDSSADIWPYHSPSRQLREKGIFKHEKEALVLPGPKRPIGALRLFMIGTILSLRGRKGGEEGGGGY